MTESEFVEEFPELFVVVQSIATDDAIDLGEFKFKRLAPWQDDDEMMEVVFSKKEDASWSYAVVVSGDEIDGWTLERSELTGD